MTTIYALFKFIHVVGSIVWIGGVITLTIINSRLSKTGDLHVIRVAGEQSMFFGQRVIGPSTGITLLAGIVMLFVGRLGFPFWVAWGLVSMVASGAIGGGAVQKVGKQLGERMRNGAAGDVPTVVALRQRINRYGVINILILISAVWAMVFRPMLW